MPVVGNECAVVHGKAGEGTLIGILRIVGLLLESLLVVVVIEAVLRAVGTLGSDKAGTIAKRQLLAVDRHLHQTTCLLAEGIFALTVRNQQLLVVLGKVILLGVLTKALLT